MNNVSQDEQDEYAKLAIDNGMRIAIVLCHMRAFKAGWYDGVDVDDKYFIGTRYALMHSEISEGFEYARKGSGKSDHIPEFTGEEEELADLLIRVFDYAGSRDLAIVDAFFAKLEYNLNRADHKRENREKEGGKKF